MNLENVTHEDAVATLKATSDRVVLTVAKTRCPPDFFANHSASSPPSYIEDASSPRKWFLTIHFGIYEYCIIINFISSKTFPIYTPKNLLLIFASIC